MAAVPGDGRFRTGARRVLNASGDRMRRNRVKALVWPAAVFAAGAVGGWLADIVVGRWQDYHLYGLTRPVADLLMIVGAVWLVGAVIGLARDPRR